jgi:hypothetical protein
VTRALAATVGLAVVFAVTAGAAAVDPKALVLHHADMPAGYRVVPDQSGMRSNRELSKAGPEHRRQVERSGRVTGFFRLWQRRAPGVFVLVGSLADVCRDARGATAWLAWLDARARLQSTRTHLRRRPVRVGDEGWAYSTTRLGGTALVGWRRGRVVALVSTSGLGLGKALDLARSQQRRIAAALG